MAMSLAQLKGAQPFLDKPQWGIDLLKSIEYIVVSWKEIPIVDWWLYSFWSFGRFHISYRHFEVVILIAMWRSPI